MQENDVVAFCEPLNTDVWKCFSTDEDDVTHYSSGMQEGALNQKLCPLNYVR